MSPSTQQFDKIDKFKDYQAIETLEEYILIAQDKMQIECHRRVQKGAAQQWTVTRYTKGDRLILQSIDLEIAVEELYRGVSEAII